MSTAAHTCEARASAKDGAHMWPISMGTYVRKMSAGAAWVNWYVSERGVPNRRRRGKRKRQ